MQSNDGNCSHNCISLCSTNFLSGTTTGTMLHKSSHRGIKLENIIKNKSLKMQRCLHFQTQF